MPDYPWLTVEYPHHPGAEWEDEEIRQLAKELAPKVVAMLTEPATTS